jgi:phosphoribosylformimino-5-aminoimidazole carboxamide ribonucleotide (ProFAR) isomerase
LRSAFSALATLLVACAGAAVSTKPVSANIAFSEVATTVVSAHEGDARLIVSLDAAEIARAVPNVSAPAGLTLVAALQGQQRTGGYAIRITSIERDGARLVVHATFTTPPKDAIVTQILTSPAHVVSVASGDVSGIREAVLLDESGKERARASVP